MRISRRSKNGPRKLILRSMRIYLELASILSHNSMRMEKNKRTCLVKHFSKSTLWVGLWSREPRGAYSCNFFQQGLTRKYCISTISTEADNGTGNLSAGVPSNTFPTITWPYRTLMPPAGLQITLYATLAEAMIAAIGRIWGDESLFSC